MSAGEGRGEAGCRFTVPIHYRLRRDRRGRAYEVGDVSGYETMTRPGRFSPRAKRYHAWCQRVRLTAMGAGFTRLPLPAPDRPVRIDVACWFGSRKHAEVENVRKGVVDALYYPHSRVSRRHLDRWVYGSHEPAHYDRDNPRVEVTVSIEGTRDGRRAHDD